MILVVQDTHNDIYFKQLKLHPNKMRHNCGFSWYLVFYCFVESFLSFFFTQAESKMTGA